MFGWIKLIKGTHRKCSYCGEIKPIKLIRYRTPTKRKKLCDVCYNKHFRYKRYR